MPKRIVVVGAAGLPGLECAVLPCERAGELPPCDVAVLLGDPAQSGGREELLRRNIAWVREAAAAARRSPSCVLVAACRPCDALALAALRASGLPRERVLGIAGLTESLRLAVLIGAALKVDPRDVRAAVLGGCGEPLAALPPLWSVGGIPAEELLPPAELARLSREACAGAAAPELLAAAAELVRAVTGEGRRLLTASAFLEGEYGVQGIFLAVPLVLGPRGLERIVQLNLKVAERAALQRAAGSARALRETIEVSS